MIDREFDLLSTPGPSYVIQCTRIVHAAGSLSQHSGPALAHCHPYILHWASAWASSLHIYICSCFHLAKLECVMSLRFCLSSWRCVQTGKTGERGEGSCRVVDRQVALGGAVHKSDMWRGRHTSNCENLMHLPFPFGLTLAFPPPTRSPHLGSSRLASSCPSRRLLCTRTSPTSSGAQSSGATWWVTGLSPCI